MTVRYLPRLHPHEWLFGGFLLIMALRLFASAEWAMGLGFAGMAVLIHVAATGEARWPGKSMLRTRFLVLPVLVNLVYPALGPVMRRLDAVGSDTWLLRADRWLFGETPAVMCGIWNHPVLTEFLSGCYLLFFPAVLTGFVITVMRPGREGLRFYDGIFGIYAIGFLGYTLVPAAGPHLAMPDAFPVPLEGGLLTQLNASIVRSGSNHVDVFPSLHTAIPLFLCGWLRLRQHRLFWISVVPASGILISTIYLRYHYAVDVVAGICLAGIGLRLSRIKPAKTL